ncbi:hypothetical protein [Bacillus sp. V2I10]|nr:hypothetical protein [Bacillus sp. V2I10]MDQ0861781.1 aryl-alcohol dehydrogenase-like predicted oxidoreductase [Bacillus sp. V2I10]
MKPETPLRRLGETELMVSALGLGTWQFSKGSGMPAALKRM